MDDIDRVSLPTPFQVGPVNCYLLSGDGLTVVDPGPATTDTIEAFDAALAERGHSIADVTTVLITHPHMDHFGGARRLVDAADAAVVAHADAVDHLSDPVGHFEREREFFDDFLRRMGVPADTVESVLSLPEPYAEFQEPITPDEAVAAGDRIDVGTTLECVHTPGHAVGSVCYVARELEAVFTGDHVLPDVTPNPLLTIRPDGPAERTRSLPTYLDSLEKLRDVDGLCGYPGHGDPVRDVEKRIDETIAHHHERKETIAGMIETEYRAPYDLMQELFPQLPATEAFPGMSELIGHLDLLEDEDRLEWTESDGVRRCRLAE